MTADKPLAIGIRKVSRTVRYAVVEVFERRFFFHTRAGTVEHINRSSVITCTRDIKGDAVTEAKRLSQLLDVPYMGEDIDLL
jgi:hypothetical protein